MASKKSETPVKSRDELKKVDLAHGTPADTEPKLVNLDNGTTKFEDSTMEKLTAPEIVQGAAKMDNAEPTNQVFVDNIITPVVVRERRIIDERLTPEAVERYKEQNPTKAAAKEEELKRKLAEAKKA